MDRNKALIIAKESLIKEKIKLKELVKYFDLSVEGKNLELIIKNFYQKKGLKKGKTSKNEGFCLSFVMS